MAGVSNHMGNEKPSNFPDPLRKIKVEVPDVDLQHPTASTLSQYILPEELRPRVSHSSQEGPGIPIINLTNLDDTHRLELAKEIVDASRTWGAFQVTCHGISSLVVDQLHMEGHKLFQLSKEKKDLAATGSMYGYGVGAIFAMSQPSWIERFHFPCGGEDGVREHAGKLLPASELDKLSTSVKNYAAAVGSLSQEILKLWAIGLNFDPEMFSQHFQSATSADVSMRLNYYPPCSQPHLAIGLTAHTDETLFTVLQQDEVGGLQVQHHDTWVAVRPEPGAFTFLVGDLLEAWTNGHMKSVEHRAVLNDKCPRLSIATFYGLPLDTLISTPENLVDELHPRLYKPFLYKEFREALLQRFSTEERAELKTDANLRTFLIM